MPLSKTFWKTGRNGAQLVGIEMGGTPLAGFRHPSQALYLLGSEDNGLPARVLEKCNAVIALEAVRQVSFNVAVTGSIVMYHRVFHANRNMNPPIFAFEGFQSQKHPFPKIRGRGEVKEGDFLRVSRKKIPPLSVFPPPWGGDEGEGL